MPIDPRQQQDLVLAPGEYVFALDTTKGTVSVLVGPYQSGVSGNAVPVIWEAKQFTRRSSYEEVMQRFVNVQEGDYVEVTNPAQDGKREHPSDGSSNSLAELNFGKRVVIPGPAYFALWPRQSQKVIGGHQLRTNQYLLSRVYSDQEALANWDKAVIKKASSSREADQVVAKLAQLTTGQLLIIKGTEISFYIPPTGIEVVVDKNGNFVREAVTLERMEFCILKSEGGEKRYVQGPDVVFPSPTETFVEINGEMKFKPIELTPISGLYIKVIADYKDGEITYKEGDELFITGAEQAIYYPRPEHNVIKYGDRTVHYAVAVPKGEGRYVLDRETGEVRLVRGPVMLLPDPRKEVIARRVLDPNQVALWYPGNTRAAEVNRQLKTELETTGPDVDVQRMAMRNFSSYGERSGERSAEAFVGDALNRGTTYNQPRTITLDTKYDGAVGISPCPGFAVLVVNKSGDRRVVAGPAAILLEYDESLMPMELSTGTPKTDKTTIKTVYLQVKNNRVSDKIVGVETQDLVPVDITIAYRVNFEGNDSLMWFQVDNYVRHLTEHARSMLRSAIKQVGIEQFYINPIVIIRDAILGKAVEGGERKGLMFKENNMRVYDVDVLDVKIEDPKISALLETAQGEALTTTLQIASKARELDRTTRIEGFERQIAEERAMTVTAKVGFEITAITKQMEKRLAQLEADKQGEDKRLKDDMNRQKIVDSLSASSLARDKATREQGLAFTQQEIEQELERLRQETEEIVKRAGAIDEKLIAALQAFGDKELLGKAAEAMAPLAIFRNSGVLEVFAGLLKGTPLAEVVSQLGKK